MKEYPDEYWRRPELDTIDELETEVEELKQELRIAREGDQTTIPRQHCPGWEIWPSKALCYQDLIDLVDRIQAAMYGDDGPDVMAIHAALKHMDLVPYEQT